MLFRQDHSTTGHIIGPAQRQPQSLPHERNLTPIALGVLRFLTHAALLLGADQNFEVCIAFQIIKTDN